MMRFGLSGLRPTAAALALALLATLAALAPAQAQEAEGAYALNPGDVLRISVWREEELSREVIVRPDGRITFPLIGEVEAATRSAEDVRTAIVGRLVDFIPEPVVTVSVLSAQGNKFYVIGKVPRPGEYAMDRPMTVIQALALAGGLAQFANGNRIQILRRDGGGRQRAIAFKYSDVESGDRLESNIELLSGDVIVVP
ncbi:MAG: polysaccharide biosynthesis/export family protein [Pseudomonadota bacterium]